MDLRNAVDINRKGGMWLRNAVGQNAVAEAVGGFGEHIVRRDLNKQFANRLVFVIKRQAAQGKAVAHDGRGKFNFHRVGKFDLFHSVPSFIRKSPARSQTAGQVRFES